MIGLCLVLSAFCEEVAFEEDFGEFQEVYQEFYRDDLVANEENREELLDFIHSFSKKGYSIGDAFGVQFYCPKGFALPTLPETLLEKCIAQGSTVIDCGAGRGMYSLFFSQQIGFEGTLIAFESSRTLFKELFWNMTLNQIHNARLYCAQLGEQVCAIDRLNLQNVSLIRINANGEEEKVLKGAHKTIRRCKPALWIKMLGGIPIEWGDRYIKQEHHERLEEIQRLGYSIQRITISEYLALPEKTK